MAWWDEDQSGVQPNFDYGSALASFMGQLAGAGGQAGAGNWFDNFPGVAPAPDPGGVPTFQNFGTNPGLGGMYAGAAPAYNPTTLGNQWLDQLLGTGGGAGAQGAGNMYLNPGSGGNGISIGDLTAAPYQGLGGYSGLQGLEQLAYNPPRIDLSSVLSAAAAAAAPSQYSQPAPSLTPAWGTGTGQKLQVPTPQTGRQASTGAQQGYGQQSAAQQRQAGYGGQATAGLGGQRTSAAQGTQPYTATGQQTGTSGGATAAGAAGGIAPVAGGGVYGAQKWSSSQGSNAVDIFVPRGTPVQAPVSGTIQPGQNGQLILIGDNGLNFAFRHGQTTANGHVQQGQQIGIVNDPGLDSLGNAPWGNMPDKYQHLEMSVSRGSPYFPATAGGGGNVDAAQWLDSTGYRGTKIGRTPGPPDAQGGGMGMGGYGGTSGGGFNPFAGGMFGMGGNPMQMLQGLFGGGGFGR